MKKILSLALSFTVSSLGLVALAAKPVRAQQVASVGGSINKIKEEYERLLAVDRDPSTEPDVREMNRKFLEERRAQLRTAIETRIGALHKYQTSMKGTLSPAEGLVISNLIQALERDLSSLAGEAEANPPAAGRNARVRRPRARLVTAQPVATSDDSTPDNSTAKAEQPAAPVADADAASPEPQAPTIKINWTDNEVNDPKVSIPYEINDPTVQVESLDYTVEGPSPKKTADVIKLKRQNDQGIVRVVKDQLKVTLYEGDNTVTISDPGASKATASVKIKYTKKAAEKAEDKPKPPPPLVDAPIVGSNSVMVFAATPDADVKLYRGSAVVETKKANADGEVTFNLASAINENDVFRATQKVGDQESLLGGDRAAVQLRDPVKGGPFGIIVGGAVMSQQAQEFKQSDPFFGFLAGYDFKVHGAHQEGWQPPCGTSSKKYARMSDGTFADEDGYTVKKCETGDTELKYLTRAGDFKTLAEILQSSAERVKNSSSRKLYGGWKAGRAHLRFQGIFQADGRTAVANTSDTTTTDTATTKENTCASKGTDNDKEPCFIASRKTFDMEMHGWWDFWANNGFRIGPYAAIGASTVLSSNELQGETVTTGDGNGTGDTAKVSTSAKSDNDIKKYYEFGVMANTDLLNHSLFIQSILAYGKYEALQGLYERKPGCWTCDTSNRFIGKLRVFPSGLGVSFGQQVKAAPMFGVDLNAGRGEDHIKFFTGFAVAIKGFSFSPAAK
jgi:hypothetical protein